MKPVSIFGTVRNIILHEKRLCGLHLKSIRTRVCLRLAQRPKTVELRLHICGGNDRRGSPVTPGARQSTPFGWGAANASGALRACIVSDVGNMRCRAGGIHCLVQQISNFHSEKCGIVAFIKLFTERFLPIECSYDIASSGKMHRRVEKRVRSSQC
jgi:hypothetical protein